MTAAQGVGLEESDYPRVSEGAVSRSESAPQRDAAANDHPTKGGRERAREPCQLSDIYPIKNLSWKERFVHHRCGTA